MPSKKILTLSALCVLFLALAGWYYYNNNDNTSEAKAPDLSLTPPLPIEEPSPTPIEMPSPTPLPIIIELPEKPITERRPYRPLRSRVHRFKKQISPEEPPMPPLPDAPFLAKNEEQPWVKVEAEKVERKDPNSIDLDWWYMGVGYWSFLQSQSESGLSRNTSDSSVFIRIGFAKSISKTWGAEFFWSKKLAEDSPDSGKYQYNKLDLRATYNTLFLGSDMSLKSAFGLSYDTGAFIVSLSRDPTLNLYQVVNGELDFTLTKRFSDNWSLYGGLGLGFGLMKPSLFTSFSSTNIKLSVGSNFQFLDDLKFSCFIENESKTVKIARPNISGRSVSTDLNNQGLLIGFSTELRF